MKMKLCLLMLIPLLSACGSSKYNVGLKGGDDGEGGAEDLEWGEGPYDGDAGVPGEGEVPIDGEEPNTTEEESKPQIDPGQLTCSALDDNKEYDFWTSLISETNDKQEPGLFYNYFNNYAFKASNRVELTIKNGNDVSVTLSDQSFTAYVDNFNKAYLFPKDKKEEYSASISYLDKDNKRQTKNVTVHDGDVIDLEEKKTLSNKLEIMYVIDTTGSMWDELDYLIAEIDDVIGKVKENNPNSNISLAILLYRDKGDEYITKYSEFTTDIAKQQQFLAKQEANGGGDIPEAVQTALGEAVNKKWKSEESTKLIFHVADAPSHDEDVQSWNNSVLKAASKGIKIITVASSGIDKKCEYFFRSQSLLTGGQYVFLTNDSGIGGDHLEATTKEKLVVEYLNACMIRLIDSYHQGRMIEPVPYSQQQQ